MLAWLAKRKGAAALEGGDVVTLTLSGLALPASGRATGSGR